MIKTTGAWILVLMMVSGSCWSYGGSSSSSKACTKPKFSDFAPAEHSEVVANSQFSFNTSKNTYPDSIKVTVKDLPVAIQVEHENEGNFHISGHLPPSLHGTFARISIFADAQNNCKGSDGWLVKIAE